MRLKIKMLMAAQNCQAAVWDVKMKEEQLALCTVSCPVPGRMERSQPWCTATGKVLLCLSSNPSRSRLRKQFRL